MQRRVSNEEFGELLRTFDHTAFRLELQPSYAEPEEQETLARFVEGHPQNPTEVPGLAAWFSQIAQLVAEGKRVERVRVQNEPPTAYQQWERWAGQWNIEVGEVMRYMNHSTAQRIGLLPAVGSDDWWLLDSRWLLIMRFDTVGQRTENMLTDDPEQVVQACAWRDLAVHHAVLESTQDAAAVA